MKSYLDTPRDRQQPLNKEAFTALYVLGRREAMIGVRAYDYNIPLAEQLPEVNPEVAKATEESIGFRILTSRLKPHGVKITPLTLAFLTLLCENPGKCVVWAFTIFCATKRRPETVYALEHFCDDFPFGIPDETYQREVWEAQKAPHAPLGNLLDIAEDWPKYAEQIEAAATKI